MALINLAEDIVRERLEELLNSYDCCKCECCRTDMLALALNCVRPMYVNSQKGKLLKRLDACLQQNSVDIDIAIMKSIELVQRNPHHVSEN